MLARSLRRFSEHGWLNVVGGCCGTHEGHVRALAEAVKGLKPRQDAPAPRSTLSGVDFLEVKEDERPVIVGERTNVIGSKKFKELIVAGQIDVASEFARAQVKRGAQVIDICLANPDREELEDMRRFLEVVVKKVRVPLMIDSTDERVIEMALTYSQGKAIINSVNLEDGEERFEKVVPLARRWWWAASTRWAWPSPASASWRWPSAPSSCSRRSTECGPRTCTSIRWCFRAPPETRTISAAR